MASARLDLSSVFLYAGSIAPGWVKLSDGTEKDVTIIDSFEAVGACLCGQDERGRPQAHRVRDRPGRGCVRWHVHRQHHGLRRRGARTEPPRFGSPALRRPSPRLLRPPLGRGRRQTAPSGDHHARHPHKGGVSRTPSPSPWRSAVRPTSCCTCRDRERGRGRAEPPRLQPHRRPHPARGRHEAVRAVRHERRRPPRRHPRDHEGDARRGSAARRRAHRHGQDARREPRRPDPRPVDGKVIHSFDDPIHATGGITILHGSMAPKARW